MKNLRVGMDISQVAHKGGVAIYTQNLSSELSKNKNLEMAYFFSSLRKSYKGHLKNVNKYRLPPTFFEMLFNRWRNVSIEKFLGPLDIFHSSDWTQPPSKAKKITTYHDVVPLKYPEWSHPKIVTVHKRRLYLVEQEVDCIIAVSESTKKDLIEISHIPKEKIEVVYEAPSANFNARPKEEIENFKKKFRLPPRFVLAIGGVGERRNLLRIKEACEGYFLVISGKDIPWFEDSNSLELLYNSADCLAYCSLYEGFGLPILDAFSTSLPVITSNVSAMPEVGGDAAVYSDPFNIKDIREKIRMVMEDENLRSNLVKKGLERVKLFSWEKCARETVNIYERLMKT
jgi:glycosyltransferase involved in cell wall biosynthesis